MKPAVSAQLHKVLPGDCGDGHHLHLDVVWRDISLPPEMLLYFHCFLTEEQSVFVDWEWE